MSIVVNIFGAFVTTSCRSFDLLFVIPYVTIQKSLNTFPWHLISGIFTQIRQNPRNCYIRMIPTHNLSDVCAFLDAFLSKLAKYWTNR
jgi:hypothetical protein